MEHWWTLSDAQRAYLETVVSHIVYAHYHGNRADVIDMLDEAYRRNIQRSPLCAAILWRLAEEIEQ